jgi:hypothetical protein
MLLKAMMTYSELQKLLKQSGEKDLNSSFDVLAEKYLKVSGIKVEKLKGKKEGSGNRTTADQRNLSESFRENSEKNRAKTTDLTSSQKLRSSKEGKVFGVRFPAEYEDILIAMESSDRTALIRQAVIKVLDELD